MCSQQQHLRPPPAVAKEDSKSQLAAGWDSHGLPANRVVQLNKLSGLKKYKVSNIQFFDPTTRSVDHGAHQSFGDLLGLRHGGIYTKEDLIQNLDFLSSTQYFEKIGFDAKTNPDGTIDIYVPFEEKVYPSKSLFGCLSVGTIPEEFKGHLNRIECARECILPEQVQEQIEGTLLQQTCLRSSLLRRIVFHVHKWYHDHGFYGARVVRLGPLESDDRGIIFEVDEGNITKLDIKFEDQQGNTCQGNTNIGVIKRALPEELAVGKAYNQWALDKAIQNIRSLNLFSNVDITPQLDKRNGALSAKIVLQEHPSKWWYYDVRTSLKVPGFCGLPKLSSLHWPDATILFGRRNLKGLNRSFQSAITLGNLFHPDSEGLSFEYTYPYLDGLDNPRNRTFQATYFDTKDIPMLVNRFGIKATITENYTKKSKFTYGLVMEDIRTRSIAARGHRASFNESQNRENGPDPTTLSGTGVDRMAYLQANLTRDNTRSVNGAIVGARDVIQVDQGLGVGTKFAFFNRAKLSITRFIPLRKVKEGKGNAAPPVLVLHGAYGNCVGDLPNHEAFAIGGPHSVRGYNIGEIGASRSKLEVAAEVRIPVKNAHLYGFVEHGNDLGSSVGSAIKGHGSSVGVGIQFGPLRAEYVVDDKSRKGSILFHAGDRF